MRLRSVLLRGICTVAVVILGTGLLSEASGGAPPAVHVTFGQDGAPTLRAVPLAPPPAASVTLLPQTARPGQTLLASGTVPVGGQSYCLCLVPNGVFSAADTPTPTPSPTPTVTASPTATATPSATDSPTPTATLAPGSPNVTVTASCTLDAQGTFTITNTGGDMPSAGTWTLTLNGTPVATNSFQLTAGGSTAVHTSGLFGTLELTASGGGIPSPVSASTSCATPTPTPTPVPPDVTVTASCTLDAQGTFTITNTGGDMLSAGSWTLTENGTPVASNSFQLASGKSFTVNTSGLFGTLELTASGGGIPSPVSASTSCATPTPTPAAATVLGRSAHHVPRIEYARRGGPPSTPGERLAAGTLASGISCVASAQIDPAGTTFSNVPITAPGPGTYDLLLLDGPCGQTSATILAMDAAGDAAGLDVVEPVPAAGRSGLLLFIVALAAIAWVLLRASRG